MRKLKQFYIRYLFWKMWRLHPDWPFSRRHKIKALFIRDYSISFETFMLEYGLRIMGVSNGHR